MCTTCVCAFILMCRATFSMQICLPLLSFLFAAFPAFLSSYPRFPHVSFYWLLAPIFFILHHVSLLSVSSSPLFSPTLCFFFIRSSISVLKWPQGKLIKLSIFPKVFFVCACVRTFVKKAYLSLTDLSDRESNLSELTGCSNNFHFRNICLQATVVLQVERKWNVCSVRWDSAEMFWNYTVRHIV